MAPRFIRVLKPLHHKEGLCKCGISDEGRAALTSALRSNPSHLRHLDLSENNLGDSGVKSLSAVLENPQCKLEKLELWKCGASDEGCAALTSALRSNPSHLRDLNLSWNNLGDSGVKSLSAVLENPHCKLETLNDTVSKPYSMAGLTTVVYTFPLILADIFLSQNSRHLSPPIPTCLHSLLYLFPTLSITLDC
ncbi:hypothetical protein QTP70_001617 [Hemibagrus guttatus]|uniref:Uncharacterized protein n=1 Tax=Hemibagrus guttatus TaxID=175788 RepID=A0AAE0QCA9_9TELE|nr:hypothetical protein QTP70_001617 [Hemibagrus guttatus]